MAFVNKNNTVIDILLGQNLKRMRYGSLAGALVTLLHVIYFLINLGEPGTVKYTWQYGLILSHTFLFIVFVAKGFIVSFPQRINVLTGRAVWFFLLVTKMLLLLGAVAITVIDQPIISSITPFIIISFAVALLYLLPPHKSILLFSLAYAALFFTLPITQSDPDMLTSLRVNALSISVISIVLSVVLWRTNKTNYLQSLIIEEQKQELETANDELQNQARELRELNETKDKFFSIIAHDLRSPFTTVIGFAELLSDQLKDAGDEMMKDYATSIQKSSYLAMDLLNNLMDWARTQTGKMPFTPEKINLASLTEETLAFFADTARNKSISITTKMDDPAIVFADRKMLSSVLYNLVSNAIKFTHPGGTIIIECKNSDKETLISVGDSGIGISEDMLVDLFNIDKNLGRQGTEGEPSTGLGLQLCKEFVEQHSGKIRVESTEGKGTSFYVSLPALNQ